MFDHEKQKLAMQTQKPNTTAVMLDWRSVESKTERSVFEGLSSGGIDHMKPLPQKRASTLYRETRGCYCPRDLYRLFPDTLEFPMFVIAKVKLVKNFDQLDLDELLI